MKKLLVLLAVGVFALLGTQAFAVPPVENGPEGFIIRSFTDIVSDVNANGNNSVTESESFKWTYFEGWGQGVFYPNGYDPSHCACGTGPCAEFYNGFVVSELGFREGAEVAYEQTFEAKNGHTEFEKTLVAKSDPEPGDNNLVVNKKITFTQDPVTKGYAKHEEKVGLSVISMGAADAAGAPASGLLTLCPWAANGNGTTGGGYPPVNVGIAAGSSFNVTSIIFESNSVVNSSINPKLTYDVTGVGAGQIAAGFVVDLWEGPDGYVYGPYKASDYCLDCAACPCLPQSTHKVTNPDGTYSIVPNDCYILPQAYGEPPLAKRLNYAEHASAEGVWSFTKQVSFESVMPGAAASGTFPFNQVP